MKSDEYIKLFTDLEINKIITNYTKESGARELNRLLSSVLRKIIVDKLKNKKDKITKSNKAL